MFHVFCPGCQAMTFILGGDPDAALNCNCCPKDHHHGHAANETGTPCRPLVITAVPGTAVLQATGTGPAIGGN